MKKNKTITVSAALRLLTRSNRRTANQIANYLEKNNYKGFIGDGGSCPVYIFLQEKTRRIFKVDYEWIHVYESDPVKMNKSLKTFIRNFDGGKYPELEYNDEIVDDHITN